jgi:hypothetical protein
MSSGYSKGSIPFYDLFFAGGYSASEQASRQFLGFRRDELPARQMAIWGAAYRWRIVERPLSLLKRGYLTAAYNGGFFSDRPTRPYRFNYLNGIGLGVSVDTMLALSGQPGDGARGGDLIFTFRLDPPFD